MSEGGKFVIVVLVALLMRFLYYQSRLWQITKLRDRYLGFLAGKCGGAWVIGQTSSYKRMMSECGVDPAPLPVSPGPGLAPTKAFAEDNLGLRNERVADLNNVTMLKIEGRYRGERNRTLNPAYWVEFLVFLPRELLRHLGIAADRPAVRLSDVAWWCVVAWEIVAWIRGEGSLISLLRALAKQ